MFRHFNKHKDSYLSLLTAFVLSGLFGCASTGSPGGGLYDETPPVLKKAEPAVGAVGVKNSKITLRFDENVKLDNVMEKLVVSPPQAKMPTVKSNAKTVTIELQDTLIPNTTYSIDLGDAVQDNNEGNPLEGLALYFSTGDHIDSMQVSGYVLNAFDLEPVTSAYVGIYAVNDSLSPNLNQNETENDSDTIRLNFGENDSIFMKVPMERAGRTDAYGKFTIRGIAPGSYRIYALTDGNTNYKYDLNSEDIAFLDSLVIPSTKGEIVHDTIWADLDSTIIDTVYVRDQLVYLPNNLILRSFNEGKVTRYLDDYSRPDSIHLNIRFAAKMPELPTISVVDSLETPIELIAEPNPTKDTLVYWIKDSIHVKMDTLNLQMSYLFTDTAGMDVIRTDTLRFVKPVVKKVEKKDDSSDKKGKKKKRGKKTEEEEETKKDSLPQITYMTAKLAGNNSLDIGYKPVLEVSAPLDSLDISMLHLNIKEDTLWREMKFSVVQDSVNIRRYTIFADPHFSPGESYQLLVDSAAMHDIYGNPINTAKMEFKEKTTEEYAHLLFEVTGASEPAFVELLDEKDKPVYKVKVIGGKAKFIHVKEGKYYARLTEDVNDNGVFDAGNLSERRQPEKVYYFNALLELRANWDLLQNWNVKSIDVVKQKPDSVKQNKPKEKAEKKSKNAEYLAKMGKTPPQTNTGTSTRQGTSSRMQTVNRNR